MSEERRTVGLNEAARRALQQVIDSQWFGQDLVAFKFAVAYALAQQANAAAEGPFTTKWNVGSLDADGTLANLVNTLSGPHERVYDEVQRLGNVGLVLMADHLAAGQDVLDVVESVADVNAE